MHRFIVTSDSRLEQDESLKILMGDCTRSQLIMSKITEQVYLGSSLEARDKNWLKSKYITHIVNCTTEHPNYHPDEFNYLKLSLLDTPNQSIYHVLEKTFEYIKTAVGNGGTVYVHCHAGVSRSSSMVIYYVMKAKGWSFREALGYVKSLHPRTDPNPGFVKQLISVTPEAGKALQTPVQHHAPQPKANTYHPYDLRARDLPRRQTPADYIHPQTIESRSALMRKFNPKVNSSKGYTSPIDSGNRSSAPGNPIFPSSESKKSGYTPVSTLSGATGGNTGIYG